MNDQEYCECETPQTRSHIQRSGNFCTECGKRFHVRQENQIRNSEYLTPEDQSEVQYDNIQGIEANEINANVNEQYENIQGAEANETNANVNEQNVSPLYQDIDELAGNITDILNLTQTLDNYQWDNAAHDFVYVNHRHNGIVFDNDRLETDIRPRILPGNRLRRSIINSGEQQRDRINVNEEHNIYQEARQRLRNRNQEVRRRLEVRGENRGENQPINRNIEEEEEEEEEEEQQVRRNSSGS